MISNVLVGICSLGVAIGCVFLVLHKDYEDGLIGRVALAGMGLSGYGRCASLVENNFYMDANWIGTFLWVSLFIFMARHIYRFSRWRVYGDGEWRKPTPLSSGGKVARG